MISGIILIHVVWFKKCAIKGPKIILNIREIFISSLIWSPIDTVTGCLNDNIPSKRKMKFMENIFTALFLNTRYRVKILSA
jgi:hypothetical protein